MVLSVFCIVKGLLQSHFVWNYTWWTIPNSAPFLLLYRISTCYLKSFVGTVILFRLYVMDHSEQRTFFTFVSHIDVLFRVWWKWSHPQEPLDLSLGWKHPKSQVLSTHAKKMLFYLLVHNEMVTGIECQFSLLLY